MWVENKLKRLHGLNASKIIGLSRENSQIVTNTNQQLRGIYSRKLHHTYLMRSFFRFSEWRDDDVLIPSSPNRSSIDSSGYLVIVGGSKVSLLASERRYFNMFVRGVSILYSSTSIGLLEKNFQSYYPQTDAPLTSTSNKTHLSCMRKNFSSHCFGHFLRASR